LQKQNKKRRQRKTHVWKDVNFVRFPKELHTLAKVNTSSFPVTKTSRDIMMISSDEEDFFKPTTKTKSAPKATNETQKANTLANPKTHLIKKRQSTYDDCQAGPSQQKTLKTSKDTDKTKRNKEKTSKLRLRNKHQNHLN
jgi:hypothetical protein